MRPFIELSRRWEDCGYENQRELAAAAGIAPSSLSARMTGRLPFAADEMLSIGRLLDIPESEYYHFFVCGWEKTQKLAQAQRR